MRIPTYESHQQISSVNASTGGVGYDVNGFVNAAGMQRARGLDKLADGLNKLNAAVTAYNIDKRQEQLDLDGSLGIAGTDRHASGRIRTTVSCRSDDRSGSAAG